MTLLRPLVLPRLKPASLLLLRTGTGLLVAVWGLLRVLAQAGPGLAERYYAGLFGGPSLQLGYGAAQLLIGLLVVIGLFRKIVYPLQALILIAGALMIVRYLLDPLGLYLMQQDEAQILFFPSITLAAATLVLLAFGDEDRLSMDALLARRSGPGAGRPRQA